MSLPLTVAPGSTATIGVGFTPTAAGARNGTLSIASNAAASPATATLAGTGVAPLLRLSTLGNQIVDSAGANVRLKSINWFGGEGPNFTPNGTWQRSYTAMLDQIKALGFNCIRLPFADDILTQTPLSIDYSQNAPLVGLSAIQVFDAIINYAGSIGLYVILDHHRISATTGSGTDGWPNVGFTDAYTPAMWATMWTAMATRYHANPAVCGFDPHNEPHNPTWATWATHVEALFTTVTAIAPDWLCFVEGVGAGSTGTYWWGGYLADVNSRPVNLSAPHKLVYSPHEYGLSVGAQSWLQSTSNTVGGWPNSLAAVWNEFWSFPFQNQQVPILVGEFGGKFGFTGAGVADGNANAPYEVQWVQTLAAFLNGDTDLNGVTNLTGSQKGMSFAYWSFGPNSGDTGGLLEDDWVTVQAGKLALLAPMLAS
jgi:endoglucanase